MKKIICMLLILCLSLPLTGCSDLLDGAALLSLVLLGNDSAKKADVFEFVRNQEDELMAAIRNRDYSAFENKGFIHEISTDRRGVEFYCGGAGIGSGTSYVGFYYTPDDDMTAVWCAPSSSDSLIPCGDGYEWREPDGDNRYYTEHICGNFYYYKASF